MRRICLSLASALVALVLVFTALSPADAEGPAIGTQSPPIGTQSPPPEIRTHKVGGCNTASCDRRVLARAHRHAVWIRARRAIAARQAAAKLAREVASSGRLALASWYEDGGTTASGTHYAMGFASLMFGSRWGKAITFCYSGRCVVGHLDDHGPYVGGRDFDLGGDLRSALGCPDLCTVRWRSG